MNETCTSWNIHQVAKIKEVLDNISREAHENLVVDYKPLSDKEATVGDIALMVQSTKKKILEMFVGIVMADAHTQTYSLIANKTLQEAVNNLFTEGRVRLKLYRNKKYKYGAEYRVEVAQFKEIYQIMFQHKILPRRKGGKKNYLKIGVNFETYQWLNESAKNAGTSIGGVIEELIKIKKYCNPDERVWDKTCNPDERVWDKTCDNEPLNPAEPLNEPLNDNRELMSKIITAMQNNPQITAKKLSAKLSTSLSTIKRNIRALNKSQSINHVGSKKNGHWVITSNTHYKEVL